MWAAFSANVRDSGPQAHVISVSTLGARLAMVTAEYFWHMLGPQTVLKSFHEYPSETPTRKALHSHVFHRWAAVSWEARLHVRPCSANRAHQPEVHNGDQPTCRAAPRIRSPLLWSWHLESQEVVQHLEESWLIRWLSDRRKTER